MAVLVEVLLVFSRGRGGGGGAIKRVYLINKRIIAIIQVIRNDTIKISSERGRYEVDKIQKRYSLSFTAESRMGVIELPAIQQ